MVSFHCGSTGGGEIAGVKVNPGPTVFFLETKNGKWEVINSDKIWHGFRWFAARGLAYCTSASTKSASPSKS